MFVGLFALALQLVLSFGHIHLEKAQPSTVTLAVQAHAPGGNSAAPGDGDDDAHDICAICAALSLTASAALPTAFSLAVPIAPEQERLVAPRSVFLPSALHSLFQARAPPKLA